MSHEPNRERMMMRMCEHCNARISDGLIYVDSIDQYWCDNCISNEAEANYERQQLRDLESPPESSREEQLRTWYEHRETHKR